MFGGGPRTAKRRPVASLARFGTGGTQRLSAIGHKGERLDQGNLDVWLSMVHAMRLQAMGSECRFTSYALLKLLGTTDTGKNREILRARIVRLRANALTIKQERHTYIGGLIARGAKDEETHEWIIELDTKVSELYAADRFTRVEWTIRHALDGQPLALWLHGFYASHAKPFPLAANEVRVAFSGQFNVQLQDA